MELGNGFGLRNKRDEGEFGVGEKVSVDKNQDSGNEYFGGI